MSVCAERAPLTKGNIRKYNVVTYKKGDNYPDDMSMTRQYVKNTITPRLWIHIDVLLPLQRPANPLPQPVNVTPALMSKEFFTWLDV